MMTFLDPKARVIEYGVVYCLTCWWTKDGDVKKLLFEHRKRYPNHEVRATDTSDVQVYDDVDEPKV